MAIQSAVILKALTVQLSNLVTSIFYLSGTFWMNFSKIGRPGGLLPLIFNECSDRLGDKFLLCFA